MIRMLVALICVLLPLQSFAADHGITARESPYSVQQTLDRLEVVLKERGVKVFARIDHAGEASNAGLKLLPTQLLIFGNPRSGTPLMNAHPTVAIDLPMKALAWQDTKGKVWIAFNSADYMKERHDLTDEQAKSLAAVGGLIDSALK
jgi:uncharacterized protein (DUF302 family)